MFMFARLPPESEEITSNACANYDIEAFRSLRIWISLDLNHQQNKTGSEHSALQVR